MDRNLGRESRCWLKMNHDEEPTTIYPPEVIKEILSWLPIKYLIQLQLVCKQWQAFVHDRYFIEKQKSRSPVSWHLWNSRVSSRNNSQNMPSFYYIHGCDGLVLLKDNCSHKYMLWNPVTHSKLELPDAHSGAYEPAISFVPVTGSYIIVSFYKDRETREEGCEILSPGQNQSWRQLAFPQTKYDDKERVLIISTGAAVHCVRVMKDGNVEIVSLDTQTECLTVSHLPRELSYSFMTIRELEWNGKLGFVKLVGRNLELIELEDYKKGRWCEKKKVIPLSFRKEGDEKKGDLFPLFAKDGEIWFWSESGRIFTYSLDTKRVLDVKESTNFAIKNKLYLYKPSLITFKGMVPACDALNRLGDHLKFD